MLFSSKLPPKYAHVTKSGYGSIGGGEPNARNLSFMDVSGKKSGIQ